MSTARRRATAAAASRLHIIRGRRETAHGLLPSGYLSFWVIVIHSATISRFEIFPILWKLVGCGRDSCR